MSYLKQHESLSRHFVVVEVSLVVDPVESDYASVSRLHVACPQPHVLLAGDNVVRDAVAAPRPVSPLPNVDGGAAAAKTTLNDQDKSSFIAIVVFIILIAGRGSGREILADRKSKSSRQHLPSCHNTWELSASKSSLTGSNMSWNIVLTRLQFGLSDIGESRQSLDPA
jgi:hypothetical protein